MNTFCCTDPFTINRIDCTSFVYNKELERAAILRNIDSYQVIPPFGCEAQI